MANFLELQTLKEKNKDWLLKQKGIVGIGIGKECLMVYVFEINKDIEKLVCEKLEGVSIDFVEVGEIKASKIRSKNK